MNDEILIDDHVCPYKARKNVLDSTGADEKFDSV